MKIDSNKIKLNRIYDMIYGLEEFLLIPDYDEKGEFQGSGLKRIERNLVGYNLENNTIIFYFKKPITKEEKEVYMRPGIEIDKNLRFKFLISGTTKEF